MMYYTVRLFLYLALKSRNCRTRTQLLLLEWLLYLSEVVILNGNCCQSPIEFINSLDNFAVAINYLLNMFLFIDIVHIVYTTFLLFGLTTNLAGSRRIETINFVC